MESKKWGKGKLNLGIVEVGYFHDFLFPFKYLLSSFNTFLGTDPSLPKVSVLVNWHFPVGKNMVETKHCKKVSIPQESS